MNNYFLKYGLLIILLLLIQVLIGNNILFLGYINPLIYILFIFVYPIKENKTSLLLFSFLLGILLDFFTNSGGTNAAATVFIAFIRLHLLRIVQNNTEFDYLLFTIKKLNFIQSLVYISVLVFFHHLVVFYLEFYTLKSFSYILLKTIYTSIFSSILIGISISLFVKKDI